MKIETVVELEEVRHGQVRVYQGGRIFELMFGPEAGSGEYVAQDSVSGEVVVLRPNREGVI